MYLLSAYQPSTQRSLQLASSLKGSVLLNAYKSLQQLMHNTQGSLFVLPGNHTGLDL
jgi:hypothetical protein